MRRSVTLLRADALRIARDPMLLLLAFIPLALAISSRVVLPWLTAILSDILDSRFVPVMIAAFLLLLTPMAFGFVIGLMLLDERDEGVLSAIAVTTFGKIGFLGHRMLVPMIWTCFASVLVIVLAGQLKTFHPTQLIALALLCGLQAPILALFLGAFAKNKVEGMALAKVGNVLIGIGALGIFVPQPWQMLAVASPHYWLVRACSEPEVTTPFIAGVAVHGVVLWGLARGFAKRMG